MGLSVFGSSLLIELGVSMADIHAQARAAMLAGAKAFAYR